MGRGKEACELKYRGGARWSRSEVGEGFVWEEENPVSVSLPPRLCREPEPVDHPLLRCAPPTEVACVPAPDLREFVQMHAGNC